MTGVTLSALSVLYWWQERHVVEQLESELAALGEDELRSHFRQLADVGDRGIRAVVRAMGARQARIGDAAERVLNERIDAATVMRSEVGVSRLTQIASALVVETERFDRAAQLRAARLASRILLWPTDGTSGDGRRLVGLCEKILRAIPADEPLAVAGPTPGAESAELTWPESENEEVRPAAGAGRPSIQARPPDVAMLALPGGDLPFEALPAATANGGQASMVADSKRNDATESDTASIAANTSSPPRPLGEAFRDARPLGAANSELDGDDEQKPTQHVSRLDNQREQSSGESGSRDRMTVASLTRLLRSNDRATAEWARNELRRRGFRESDLALLENLTHPDRHVRLQWVRRLPTLPDINPEQWLLWLTRDADADVRHTAIGLLATSNDASILRQLAGLATNDRDPRIREQGTQIQRRLGGTNVTASAQQ